MEFTQEEREAAAAKVYVAVLAQNGNDYFAAKDAIIAAHNRNAIDLQCKLTRALALLKEGSRIAVEENSNITAWKQAVDDLLRESE